VWSEDFEGPAGTPPDPARWTHDLGGGGWGNEELQMYTNSPANAAVDGQGHLVIRADRASDGYTSARITTRGLVEAGHGRLEVRAQLPAGRGTWPCCWMLGTAMGDLGWPACGEIDVVEHVGHEPGRVFSTLHGASAGGEHWSLFRKAVVPDATSSFHTYAAEWDASSVAFAVDDEPFGRIERGEVESHGPWVFDGPFFVLLNLAVGGTLGGEVPATTTWPQEFVLDFVRLYR
jgi:beta-glucanase (GH16 family)